MTSAAALPSIPGRVARRVPWSPLAFVASATAMTVAVLTRSPFPPLEPMRSFGFFDLQVYRQSAGEVLSGGRLYAATFRHGLGFTYPPFAALLFTLLRVTSLRVDEVAVTLVNLALVAALAHLALRLPAADGDRARRAGAAWWAAAVAVWLMPVSATIGFGQINLLIAVLVIADLVGGDRPARGGVMIGLAAGLKLTPLIFIVYLAFTGRTRMAARAIGAFVLTILLSFDVVPADAWAFWTRDVFGTGHITGGRPGRGPGNQSLHGAVLRLFPGGAPAASLVWLAVTVIVAGGGLWLAVRASRRGEETWGVTLVAVTGLLICPVTWPHHWVIAIPGLLVVLARWRRSPRDRRLAAGALALGLATPALELVIHAHPLGEHLTIGDQLLADTFVLIGLGLLAVAAVRELRRRGAPAGPRPPATSPLPLGPRPPVGPRPPIASLPPVVSPAPSPTHAIVPGPTRSRRSGDWAR